MKVSRGFIAPLLLVLVAVLLIGGGAYVYTHGRKANKPVTTSLTTQSTSTAQASNSQTTDWKTYRNEKYGFEMQYPSDWNITADNDGPELYFVFIDKNKNTYTNIPYTDVPHDFYVYIEIYPQGTDLNSWFQERFKDPNLMPKKESTTLGGIPALSIFDPSIKGGCSRVYIATYHNNYVYEVENPKCSGDPVIARIFSSFKFTK